MDYTWGWIVKFQTSSTILHDSLVCIANTQSFIQQSLHFTDG